MQDIVPDGYSEFLKDLKAQVDEGLVQQLVAQIPWGHNVRILDYVKDPVDSATTNFDATFPPLQSDLARQTLKNPFISVDQLEEEL